MCFYFYDVVFTLSPSVLLELAFMKCFQFWMQSIIANYISLEIDRYIGLPIYFPIFKHFTIIGFEKNYYIFFYFYLSHTIIQSITNSEMCSLYLTHPSTHTWSSGHTHTHTHTHTWSSGHTHTHTWSSGHTHTHTWSSGHTHTHTHTWSSGHTHLEQWTHTHTHTWSSGHTHTHTHTPGAVFTQEKLQHDHRM